jgi:NADPH:quinone reductase-like Zn-dependent oxidoreductase
MNMKAFQLQKFGLDSLALVEAPMPKPGAGQVCVRMRAASLNYRDLLIAKGAYNPKLRLPLVPLSDGAGEVAEAGAGVTRFKTGARVAGTFFQKWISGGLTRAGAQSALGGDIDGVLAEYVLFDEDGLVEIPRHLSYEAAATLPCAALAAWHAVVVSGRTKAGDSVLLQGTGGVSLFALQFARLHGARAIITSSSDAKLGRAKHLGAQELINYRTTPDWEEKVRQLTGGSGVDHVIEVGGAGTLPKSLRAVRIGGHVALIGVLAGGGEVNPLPILMRHIRVQGIHVGSREMFEAMNRAIELHQLQPVIDKVFAFEQTPAALRHLESGAHFGKIVIRISDD